MTDVGVEFFVSYTSADRPWAEWIAWELEAAGYSTIVQAWDMVGGSNFVLKMDVATSARRTIAVLSAGVHDVTTLSGRVGSGVS